jgi:4-amino-4-deoxychorismate lyase
MKTYLSFDATPEHFSTNRAIAYGDGLFETILLCNGTMPLWSLHMQRLQFGLKQLGLQKITEPLLLDKIEELRANQVNGIIKLIVFRQGKQRGYSGVSSKINFMITINPLSNSQTSDKLDVSSVHLSSQKKLAGLKHLNRLEQVLAANELIDSTYSDALMLDAKKRVIETVCRNIVLIKGNKLYSPKLNNCGVYGVALRWLESQGYELKWKKIEFKTLHKYDGFFVCNSIRGFNAITSIKDKFQFRVDLPVIEEIQKQWRITINT